MKGTTCTISQLRDEDLGSSVSALSKPLDDVNVDSILESSIISSGVCVDCTLNLEQCECRIYIMDISTVKPLGEEAPFKSFVCSRASCRPLSCGGCSRCPAHCICKWTNKNNIEAEGIYPFTTLGPKRQQVRHRYTRSRSLCHILRLKSRDFFLLNGRKHRHETQIEGQYKSS